MPLNLLKPAALAVLTIAVTATSALAVSSAVRMNCRDDYFTHCPNHAIGSENLRRCMKVAGPKLSSNCIKALVASGEISKAEIKEIARKLKSSQ